MHATEFGFQRNNFRFLCLHGKYLQQSHFPITLVMTNLDCQLDYIWNQLTFLQGIFLTRLFEAGRPILNFLWHQCKRTRKKGTPFCLLCSLSLENPSTLLPRRFLTSLRTNIFVISTQIEDQQLSRHLSELQCQNGTNEISKSVDRLTTGFLPFLE